MKNLLRAVLTVFFVHALVTGIMIAKDPPDAKRAKENALDKIAQTKVAAILNINNFTIWQQGQGRGAYPPNNAGDGGFFPRGTRWVIFADGFVWSAKAYLDAAHTQPAPVQVIRTGGSTYNVGNDIGWINGTGANAVALGAGHPDARIYRIRRDYTVMSENELRLDAAENFLINVSDVTDADIQAVLAQYEKDWKEWPVDKGAPYIERNGVPGFQRPPDFSATFTVDSLIAGGYDEPGIAGVDPNSPANQVIWSAMNDLNRGNMIAFAGSEPMGLEMQLTLWGYKRTDALGNLYFKRIKFINKGGADVGGGNKGFLYLDSVYFAQWSDPDLGAFGDDLAGCDTVLSMGFVYNGNPTDAEFIKFNLPPPAVGYDFLAGPAVPGAATDTAVFDLKKKPGYRNLPMTSFSWFSAGSGISDPPFNYEGALRWNRMLRGFVPDPSTQPERLYPSGPFPPSKFPLSGNPNNAGTGFVDGLGQDWSFPPGDRRIVMSTGPFTLGPLDTQEVVVGVVAGLGADRISSVAVMKANDAAVQTTYNLLFQVSQPPATPLPVATELDGRVVIEWGSNVGRVRQTESDTSNPGRYVFEGYNVYQLPSPGSPRSEWRRIATYDLVNGVGVILSTEFDLQAAAFLQKPIQFGSNSGIKRFFVFDRDYVTGIDKLYNGHEYYIAITAYSRPLDAGYLEALESSANILRVRPKKPYGALPATKFGDPIPATRVAGTSDGSVSVEVISPTSITGDTYEIRFDASGWNLINTTKNATVLSGQRNQSGDESSPIADGMLLKVQGAPNDFKDFLEVANANGPHPPTYAAFQFNNSGFPSATFPGAVPGNGSDRPAPNVAGAQWGIHTGNATGDQTFDFHYPVFVARTTQNEARWPRIIPYDWEIRFTATGGVGFEPNAFVTGAGTGGTVINVPFELWRIGINTPNDPSDDVRLFPYLIDWNANGQWDFSGVDHTISGGDNDPETDWFYWVLPADQSPGQAGYNAIATDVTTNTANHEYLGPTTAGTDVMRRMVFVLFNGGSVSDPTFPNNIPANRRLPETGQIFRIISTKPNTSADIFRINTASYAVDRSVAQEKASIDRIRVFPNPYYAFNPAETNRFVRFVTFNNLPQKVTVRIFNLGGQMVRILEKDNSDQFLRWDLNNQHNFPVASGIYIAHLDMTLSDGSKATKVLKLAIIQEQEVPDVF
ncbi:MAG TPA: T9SS type A sorting domain-containing protein [Bacteroidota bacterium]|nr:T9SS type A sorting domain-containing protein [Bacteroidota bacterium]